MTTKVPGFKVPFIKFFVYKKSEDGLGEFETYESAIAYAKERLKENRGIASIEVYGKVDTSTLKEVESKSSRNTYYRVEDIFVDGYEKVLGLPMKIIISGHAIDGAFLEKIRVARLNQMVDDFRNCREGR